jgi:hypothetical protein
MSISVAPRFPATSVFIPAYWENARGELLTQDEADARYLKFPTGQGTESIPNLIVSGSSTLGTTSTNALTATQFTATTGSYGSAQKFYANTSDNSPLQLTTTGAVYTEKYIRMYSGSASTNSTLFIQAEQTDAYAQLQLQSGNNLGAPRVILQQYVDYATLPAFGGCNNILDMNGNTLTITNGNAPSELPDNSITMSYNSSYANNYIQLRVAFDYISESSVFKLGYNFFNWSIQNLDVMNINSTSDRIELRRNMRQDTKSDTGDTCGILETGIINTTTTGSTTLTFATNAFRTTINTPSSAGRVIVLPTPASSNAGYWLGICNKSTTNLISVQYPSGTTIYNIPVAPVATNGGSSARFAVGPSPFNYFRVA